MSSKEPASLIPVTLLTGFLGSGKTTVLNHVLKQPDMAATAVIVNEFGEIGLDHLLVERGRRVAQQRVPLLHGAQ
jgi:G3E family GTPase